MPVYFCLAASFAVIIPSSLVSKRRNSETMLSDNERLYSLIDTWPSLFVSRDVNHDGRPVGSLSVAFEKRYECRLSASLPVPPAVPVSTRLANGSSVLERLSLLEPPSCRPYPPSRKCSRSRSLLRPESLLALVEAVEVAVLAGVLVAVAPAE